MGTYNEWYFSPAYQIDVELLVGGKANPPGITGYEGKTTTQKMKDIMDAYEKGHPPDLRDLTAEVEFSPFGKYNVIPKTSLGLYHLIPQSGPAALKKVAKKVVGILEKQCCLNGKKGDSVCACERGRGGGSVW